MGWDGPCSALVALDRAVVEQVDHGLSGHPLENRSVKRRGHHLLDPVSVHPVHEEIRSPCADGVPACVLVVMVVVVSGCTGGRRGRLGGG